ncbi:MAG: hypothetical protein ACKOVB_21340 [Terrabacter sp.]
MRNPTLAVAAAATLLLTAASLTAIALGQGNSPSGRLSTTGWMRGALDSSACAVPTSLPGTTVTVMLGDMGAPMMGDRPRMGPARFGGPMMPGGTMMMRAIPETVRSGQISLVAYNHGVRPHELVVLPLVAGASVGARTVGSDWTTDETGSLGETSTSCGTGRGNGLAAGAAGWVTVTLRPGRYELLCNLPGHYAAGMYTELDVT